MTQRTTVAGSLLLLSLVVGCGTGSHTPLAGATAERPDAHTVRFRDRIVDLTPFLLGFPYSRFQADLEHETLFFMERAPDGTWLRRLPLEEGGSLDLELVENVKDEDWSKRTLGKIEIHERSGKLFVTSDRENDEQLNVYTIDRVTGEVAQVTRNDYTYGWDLSEDGRYLAYLARQGREEPFVTTLRVRDLESGEDRPILSDEGGDDRFTWGSTRFSRDNSSVILTVQHDGNRNTTSLARVHLDGKPAQFEFLIEPRVVRYSLSQVDDWISEHEFLYLSSETGFRNLYCLNLEDGSSRQLTDFEDELLSASLLETEPPTAAVVLSRPEESELVLVDARTGVLLAKTVIPARVSILDAHGQCGILSLGSLESQWEARRFAVRREGPSWSFQLSPLAWIPEDLKARVQHLNVEKVTFPTFDRLSDGSARELHAFYLTPKVPPERPEDRLILITSFYGGVNSFDVGAQIMAAMGIATFSPSPRGSSGFGAEFAALNDGDLGGDEIIDIHHAAKWLEKTKGYRPGQIGVRGASHGGYATMRCLTFPPDTNGRGEGYDYGFGWSHAGFSNILTFYQSCNIPDWVLKEAGDPVKEREKLLDRSPISHAHRLKAPLLLTHGSNDRRVPVEESRSFAKAAEALGRPVRLVEFPGQGHGIRGFENQVRYYQEVFSFLESVTPDAPAQRAAAAGELQPEINVRR
ncbi:MAG: prolyl oligopeptidase family serine peptidase [Planctomycetota bacterium]